MRTYFIRHTTKRARNTYSVYHTNRCTKKNSTISIGALIQKDISEIIKVHGKIDVPPQNLISVSIPMGGFLVSSDLLPECM